MAFSKDQVRAIVEQVANTGDLSTGFASVFDPQSTPYFNPPAADASMTAAALAAALGGFKQTLAGLQLSKQQQTAVLAVLAQSTARSWNSMTNATRVGVLQVVVNGLAGYSGADGYGGINQTSNLIAALASVVP